MHCPRLTKVSLKVKEMPGTTSLSRSHPGAIMTRVFNLQIKMTLRGPTLTNWNRNTFSISFPRRRRLHEFSANYSVFEWKAFVFHLWVYSVVFFLSGFKVPIHHGLSASWSCPLLDKFLAGFTDNNIVPFLSFSNFVTKFLVCWSGQSTFFSASRNWKSFTPTYILFLILYFCSFPAKLSSMLLMSF